MITTATSTCLLVGRGVVVDVLAVLHRDTGQPNDSSVARQVVVGTAAHAENAAQSGGKTSRFRATVRRAHGLDQTTAFGIVETAEIKVVQMQRGETTLRVGNDGVSIYSILVTS